MSETSSQTPTTSPANAERISSQRKIEKTLNENGKIDFSQLIANSDIFTQEGTVNTKRSEKVREESQKID